MARVFPVVLAALLASLAPGRAHAACSEDRATGARGDGRATGARGDTLVVGYSAGPPLVTETRDGEVRGFAVELLHALAAQEGWHLSFVELSPESLRARLSACLLDVGVFGVAVSTKLIAGAGSDPMLEVSYPYFSTVTTVIVNEFDASHAAKHGRVGQVLRVAGRGLAYGLAALMLLAAASWLLNAFSGFPGTRSLRFRRLDATVSGPWAGMRWLWRSITGRALCAVWLVIGIALGVTSAIGGPLLQVLGDDPLRAIVERAAHEDKLIGERLPDHAPVECAGGEERACFRGFADGTMSAIAGPRETLCMHALALSLDNAFLRTDLEIPEQFAYLLPPASPLRARLDLALLRQHESSSVVDRPVRCPGDPR
jgi:ABC-type amino acid transport substrate-binding protein